MMIDAAQFGRPAGFVGDVVARLMHQAHANDYAAVLERVSLNPGMRLLEIGMGAGLHVRSLLDSGVSYCGMDHAEDMVRSAKINVPEAHFICADVCGGKMPPCDAAISVNAIQWWHDPLAGLKAIRGALAPSGVVVIGLPECPPTGAVPNVGQRYFTPTQLYGLLRNAGFIGIRVWSKPVVAGRLTRPYLVARGET